MRSRSPSIALPWGSPNPPMKKNVGSYDAGVRFLAGCGILFMSVNGLGWWALLGLVPLLSAACAFCPVYWLLGVDTAAWEATWDAKHPYRPGHTRDRFR